MKPDDIILEYPKYPITGYLVMFTIGGLLTFSMGTIAWHYPALRVVMIVHILLSWVLVAACLTTDYALHLSRNTLSALLQYIKVKNSITNK